MIARIDMPRRRPLTRPEPAAADESGRRDVTVKAIAAAVGLSQPAVSQVLNGTGRISAETRDRVLKTAEEMGYRPNAAARAIVTRKTRQVGVLVLNNPDDPETFPQTYYTILGMNMALEKAGYVLCLVRLGDVEGGIEGHSRVFREHVLDGVIVTTNLPEHISKRIRKLMPSCIWADTNRWAKTCCVRRDEVAVGRQLGEAAAAAGYRRVVFLTEESNAGGVSDHYSHADRRAGLAEACAQHGVALEVVQHSWFWSESFHKGFAPKLRRDVAVITTDQFRARMVQQTAALKRLMIGDDFGLACCDNSGDILANWPSLSGVRFDRIELGKRAAEMMLALLEGGEEPKSLLLPSAWHGGETLGGPRPAAAS